VNIRSKIIQVKFHTVSYHSNCACVCMFLRLFDNTPTAQVSTSACCVNNYRQPPVLILRRKCCEQTGSQREWGLNVKCTDISPEVHTLTGAENLKICVSPITVSNGFLHSNNKLHIHSPTAFKHCENIYINDNIILLSSEASASIDSDMLYISL
jgi:hypothetical protein